MRLKRRAQIVCTIAGCGQPHDAKGFCRSHYKRWRLHGDPLMVKLARGTAWTEKGYVLNTINGKSVREHRVVAERVLGRPLPHGAVVHHVDEDRANNANINLVICPSAGYHRILHQRMDAMKATGSANYKRCTFCKCYDDPLNMRAEKSGRYVHAKCSAAVKRHRLRVKRGLPSTVASRALAACGNAHWRKCWICKTYSDPETMMHLVRTNGTGYFYHQTCQNKHSAANYRKRTGYDIHV